MHSLVMAEPEGDWTAGRLAAELPPILAEATCAEVYEILQNPEAQRAVTVVDHDGRVVGLVNRLRFLAHYAKRFIPELYDKRPITSLANTSPFIVDEKMPISELASLVTLDHPDALRECFVVIRNGRYLGIGTSEALVRAKVELLTAREQQLKQALIAAEDADRTRANFLALMSHELRTPLNAIIGFSEVLANELFGPHGVPKYLDYSKDITGAGRHLLALINDILDLSKSEAGQMALFFEPVDIAVLLKACVHLLSTRAAEGKVKLQLQVPDDLPQICADGLRLKQVVLNILSNAVKFTMPGGRVKISAHLNREGGLEISIADNGIGMDPKMIPVALEPFRQIDSPMSRNVEGTGLGLSLAKSLAERHDGSIAIESALDVGTTVRVILPPERTIGFEMEELKIA